MSQAYRSFFGFTREPFSSDLKVDEILQTEAVLAVADRVDYAIRLGAMAMITGDVGSGKSTALRFAASRLHRRRLHPGTLSSTGLETGGRNLGL